MGFTVYGYGRASTDGQVLSTHQQEDVVREAFELFRKCKPAWQDAKWGGFFRDEDVCRVTKFRERPNGSIAFAALQPDDVLIVSNYDRIFANVIDVAETLELFAKSKRRLLILDMDFDTSTDMGAGMMKLMAVVKEMEWCEIRRRCRDSIAYRKKIGRYTGVSPIGWKNIKVVVDGKVCTYYGIDYPERRYCNEIMRLKDDAGLTFTQIILYVTLNKVCNPRTGRPTSSTNAIFKAYTAAKRNFELSFQPAPIPPGAKPYKAETIKVGS